MKYRDPAPIILGLALSLFSACATTHPGRIAKPEKEEPLLPLVVSAQTVNGSRFDSFVLVHLTFENTGDPWVRVDETEVAFPAELVSKASVVVGKDLSDWAHAVAEREKMREHNEQVALGALALGSTIAAVAAGNGDSEAAKTARFAGAVGLSGALAYSLVDTLSTSQTLATSPKQVPENHVYRAFAVPGKLFIRRWLVLNKPAGTELKSFTLRVKSITGEEARYAIAL